MWVRRRGRYYLYRTQDVQVRPWWSGSGGGERMRAEDIIEAPPMVLAGKVFVGSSDFNFYALDETTGELAW